MNDHEAKGSTRTDDAEQAVLSSVLNAPDVLGAVAAIVTRADFLRPSHARIFDAMLEVAACGALVDPLTLAERLEERGELEAIGGKNFIAHLIDVVPSAANVAAHAGIVRDHAQRRALAKVFNDGAALASEGKQRPATVAASVRTALQNFEQADAPGEARLAAPTSITSLLAAPEPVDTYLVEGLVPADGNLLMAAYPKSHKTNLVLALSVGATSGFQVLGRFAVPRRHRVGLVLMEDRAHRVRRRLRRLCEAHSIDLEDLDGYLHIWFRPILRLNDPRVMDELRGYVERLDLDLLWIDSWAYVAVGNSDKDDVVSPQLDALTRLRDYKPGLAVGLTHHARKTQGDTNGQRLTDVIRNSSHFSAWYDAGYVLSRVDESSPVTVRSELRDLPAPASFSFRVEDQHPGDPTQGIAPSGWMRLRALEGTPASVNRENAAAKQVPAVREFLAAHPGASVRQLRDGVGGRGADVDAAFDALVAAGAARLDAPAKRGQPSHCWLTTDTVSDRVPSVSRTHSESDREVCPIPIRVGHTSRTHSAQQEISDLDGTRSAGQEPEAA